MTMSFILRKEYPLISLFETKMKYSYYQPEQQENYSKIEFSKYVFFEKI